MTNPVGPSGGPPPNQPPGSTPPPPATGPFAKLFPGASPAEVKKITDNFINFTIQQMKQDQANMLQALQKMQDDQDQ